MKFWTAITLDLWLSLIGGITLEYSWISFVIKRGKEAFC